MPTTRVKEKTTWRSLISFEMKSHGDSWDNVAGLSVEEEDLDIQFDPSYGIPEGVPFLLWTITRVYFPVQYDGSEWVESVPRYPCNEKLSHVGGG